MSKAVEAVQALAIENGCPFECHIERVAPNLYEVRARGLDVAPILTVSVRYTPTGVKAEIV